MFAKFLATGFLVWYAVVAVVGGVIGAALNCEGGEGCKPGSPSWLEPWTWGEYSVFPEALFAAIAGLVPAIAFVTLILRGRRLPALATFALAVVLLSYAFFAGLTTAGRMLLAFGFALGVAALLAGPRRASAGSRFSPKAPPPQMR